MIACQTENFGFVGIYLQSHPACLLFEIQSRFAQDYTLSVELQRLRKDEMVHFYHLR